MRRHRLYLIKADLLPGLTVLESDAVEDVIRTVGCAGLASDSKQIHSQETGVQCTDRRRRTMVGHALCGAE